MEDTMLKERFDELAAYNRWANARLYKDAASLSDDVRKRPIGLFFSSIHGTLNHLLVADYIWMRRFTGDGPQPERLNQILHDDFEELRAARGKEDERIFDFVTSIPDYRREIAYRNSTGKTFHQRLAPALTHFFNHQAHHRGQIHAGLTIVGIQEPESLDLLGLQRSMGG
ncbi:MAG TPA: DinB family protein [Rhodopila sp.]|uniref:DinB family protein n=1 Tax=Rhodopila sp. TaxID=2480087 RepID=UPI002B8533A7|nr:DinB family protein [Rhodopila sp.]HVY18286.1 DinB family protein [Rhodopila sp.]